MGWSVDTLKNQILGELNQDRNASGGSVPDRLENLVKEALRYVWMVQDWIWQLKKADWNVWTTKTGAASGAPVKDNGTSTVTAAAAMFHESMIGHNVAFTGGSSYQITAYTNTTVVVVSGDASGESDGGAMTVTADSDYAMPADFREMNSWEAKDEDEGRALVFTQNARRWLQYNQEFDSSSDTGHPKIACIMRDTGITDSMSWLAKITPLADDDYVFPIIHLLICPIDLASTHSGYKSDSSEIIMPEAFHEGWHLRALYKCQRRFGQAELAKETRNEFKEWLKTAIDENNETITDSPDVIMDGYMDVDAFGKLGERRQPNPYDVLPDMN